MKRMLTINRSVWGDLTEVGGDLSGISGDLTGVSGDLSGISGNVDDCEISIEQRSKGVNVQDLIK